MNFIGRTLLLVALRNNHNKYKAEAWNDLVRLDIYCRDTQMPEFMEWLLSLCPKTVDWSIEVKERPNHKMEDDDRDSGFGPFVEGLYNASREVDE